MWQQWYERQQQADLFVAIAADAQGPAAARPWVERAEASFPVAVDTENKLGAMLGYTVVPTGILVDGDGSVRHLQAGDFSVRDENTLARIDRFLSGDPGGLRELTVQSGTRVTPLAQELIKAKVRLAAELLARGRSGDALVELDRALELDPDNYVIRKQRWHIRHPERFEPEIDWEWQKRELAREREAERQARDARCGPDGCPIPRARS